MYNKCLVCGHSWKSIGVLPNGTYLKPIHCPKCNNVKWDVSRDDSAQRAKLQLEAEAYNKRNGVHYNATCRYCGRHQKVEDLTLISKVRCGTCRKYRTLEVTKMKREITRMDIETQIGDTRYLQGMTARENAIAIQQCLDSDEKYTPAELLDVEKIVQDIMDEEAK